MFETQGDVELGLEIDEHILALGEKSPVEYVCSMLLCTVFCIAGLFVIFFVPEVHADILMCGILFIFCVIILFFLKCIHNSYQYNRIYITNKRIIVTQKDRIEGIPFVDVNHFTIRPFHMSRLILKSKREFLFSNTNIEGVIFEFLNTFPDYKLPKYTLSIRDIILILLGIFIWTYLKIPQVHDFFKFNKTLNKSEIVEIKDQESYMNYVQRVLKFHWAPPKLEQNAQVIVEFQIMPDGTIFDEKVIQTSGNRELDNSTLFAINSASPLRNLPPDLAKEKEVKINFTFDYNVIDKNKK